MLCAHFDSWRHIRRCALSRRQHSSCIWPFFELWQCAWSAALFHHPRATPTRKLYQSMCTYLKIIHILQGTLTMPCIYCKRTIKSYESAAQPQQASVTNSSSFSPSVVEQLCLGQIGVLGKTPFIRERWWGWYVMGRLSIVAVRGWDLVSGVVLGLALACSHITLTLRTNLRTSWS